MYDDDERDEVCPLLKGFRYMDRRDMHFISDFYRRPGNKCILFFLS